MARFEESVTINRPVEGVFTYATDIKSWPQWHETIVEAEQTSQGPAGVGTTFKGKAHAEGRTTEFTGKVTEYAPYKRSRKVMNFGNFVIDDTLMFDPTDGGTRFTIAYDVKVRGIAKLMSSRINSGIHDELKQAVSKLKTVLESQS
ncbi:MAG: SRPBCC family protein [Halobacteriota archaeon]